MALIVNAKVDKKNPQNCDLNPVTFIQAHCTIIQILYIDKHEYAIGYIDHHSIMYNSRKPIHLN